ncbi:hypothetical protein [Neomegalonema perideroedes]|uniref:hypothetical protein n=1 Tax=Neomegalonema perideroedes TaxID=217219 RepID=UPI000382B175|nr:hypothetical protein [Neomegalonema perideroedes]
MRFSLRFLGLLLLGPFASFAPLDRVSAAQTPLELREGEALRLRAAVDPAWLRGLESRTALARIERLGGAEEAPRRVFERRLSVADFDAAGRFGLEVPRAALEGARHRLTLRLLSAEGRAIWTASALWEPGALTASLQDLPVQDLGPLTPKPG